MFISLNPVSVHSEKPAGQSGVLPLPELVRVSRGGTRPDPVIDGIGPGPGRVVVADLIGSLLPGPMIKAGAGSRRYLLPPPSPG